MRFSMTSKSCLILAGSVLITAAAVFAVSRHHMHDGFETTLSKQVDVSHNVVNESFDATKRRLLAEVPLFAESGEGIEAFRTQDFAQLKKFAQHVKSSAEAGFVTLTDAKGTVIARAGSDKRGDSIAGNALVSVAMQGTVKGDLVRMANNGLSIGAAAPVFIDGKVAGTILLGEGFRTHAFVDKVKSITGLEVTVFDIDTRLSTTLQNEKGRAVGTKLNNPQIENKVLKENGVYHATANIFGKPYKTMYWPMRNGDGQILGMWFIGSSMENMEKTVGSIAFACFLAALGIAVFLCALGALFFRSMVLPLKKTVEYAAKVAGGNLDANLVVRTRNDEAGDLSVALRQMVQTLKDKISESDQAVKEARENGLKAKEAMKKAEESARMAEQAKTEGMHAAAEKLDGMARELSKATKELTTQISESGRGAEESGSRLNEAASAMNEMNCSVQDVARNASSAASISDNAKNTAADGKQILQEAMESIDDVQKVSEQLKEDMNELHDHTQNISKIMDVISDIADQTNLLALNAAIEAARAGEAGRGFAVVADEVRKLAEKTMNSTHDVSTAITSIQESASQSVNRMNQALESVEKANSLARKSGEALEEIVTLVDDTARQVQAIATASEEQSAASDEINRSINTVNEMSTQTTQAMSTAAREVENLLLQAENINSLVRELSR